MILSLPLSFSPSLSSPAPLSFLPPIPFSLLPLPSSLSSPHPHLSIFSPLCHHRLQSPISVSHLVVARFTIFSICIHREITRGGPRTIVV
ncbi:hypothetical protein TIFTF001_022327 [Ficus carica]|uniref:Uncharacterized protein n=1 Tax=Ficus carica TaxID=3494 RepID=A0AA88DCQ1_FICCA|nr:hypothetical protein TIFTF001_022327 [Ficus carica]